MNEQLIKEILVKISKDENKTFNEVLKVLTFERMLARVAASQHKDKLIFKGGLCLRQFIGSERETMDIDFLGKKIKSDMAAIELVFKDVAAVAVDDGLTYAFIKCERLESRNKKYPGYRVHMEARLTKINDRLQIDIGIDDVVDEINLKLDVMTHKGNPVIGQGGISVLAYPPEFIFSEKLQAIISLGGINSRVKDYFDCNALITKNVMDGAKVLQAIQQTFKHRKTDISEVDPASAELNKQWQAFKKKLPSAPETIDETIETINTYLKNLGVI